MKKNKAVLNWLNPLKALALFAILLNHFVEEFGGSYPWFTYPSRSWPDFSTRMSQIFPRDYPSFFISFIQFLGWLGDNAPGVFILASGIGLTWGALHKPKEEMNLTNFYKRRLIRIYPLYITMHFVLLASSLFVPNSNLTLAGRYTLLSMLGLRFTESLFFYMNPSWWFIWLIIQLYMVFPFLYKLMRRVGWKWFLTVTFAFTFFSRLYGLLYSKSLFYWMAGIFFGTRLAEFCSGMVIAVLLFHLQERDLQMPQPGRRVLAWSFPIYLVGLGCSFIWIGTIISNLLITIGITGVFFALWKGILEKIRILAGIVIWIGVEAYSVFLLHQTPLKWTATFFHGRWHLIVAVLVLIFSFPVGWLINQGVKKIVLIPGHLKTYKYARMLSFFVAVGMGLAFIGIKPLLTSPLVIRTFSLFSGLSLVFLGFLEYACLGKDTWPEYFVRWAVIFTLFLSLFLFGENSVILPFLSGGIMAIFAAISYCFIKKRLLVWAATLVSTTLFLAAMELILVSCFPIEAGRWGELPALQIHPTRTFSLKPNQVTHLKYNNYDYILRTNSFGLASPEVDVNRPTPDTLRIFVLGNAFSMPEGMEYEDAYPALLEKNLNEIMVPRIVQVINGGVTAYSFVEEYHQIKELGPMFKPDVVILQCFITELEWTHTPPEQRLKNSGLISRQNSTLINLFEHSQIYAYFRKTHTLLKEKLTGKAGRWRYDKALLHFYRTGKNPFYTEKRLNKISFYIGEIKTVCNDIGSDLIIYFVPGAVTISKPSDIDYFPWNEDLSDNSVYDLDRPLRSLCRIADRFDIPIVDLGPYLKKHPNQPVYFPESWHWNKEGHKVVAKAIANDLYERGYLKKYYH